MLSWLKRSGAEIRDYLPQKQVSDPLFYASAFMIGACLLLGGVSRNGFISDTILAFLAIPLLALGVWRLLDTEISSQMRGALWFCSALIAIPFSYHSPLHFCGCAISAHPVTLKWHVFHYGDHGGSWLFTVRIRRRHSLA